MDELNNKNDKLISEQAAIDALIEWYGCEPNGMDYFKEILAKKPSVQPERLTDDDFETIRIHLSACKEQLCNQRRWKEAEEYQRIIDRFMSFASAQPEIIRCNACKHWTQTTGNMRGFGLGDCDYINAKLVNCNGFCYWAERRTDEAD